MPEARARKVQSIGGPPSTDVQGPDEVYQLDAQVGFRLRQAAQRHHAIFARLMTADLTPRQWAVLAKLDEMGPSAQNLLGRRTAMDAATIKGVVDRLRARGLVQADADEHDARRRTIGLTSTGVALVRSAAESANTITRQTLSPLNAREQAMLLELLAKIS